MAIKDLSNNIKKFYTFSFLRELLFIIPVVVLFWQENGLSLTRIMILQAIYTLSIALFEVPTGVFADKIGRKQSLSIGAFILLAAAVVYSAGYNFWQFAIAEIIWGLGVTFTSGADSAFVYDTLKQTRKKHDFKKIWGHAKSLEYLAAGIAAVLGGFVATYSLRLNWVLVAFSMLFLFFVSLSFQEPKHYKKLKQKKYLVHTVECFKESLTNRNLLFLLLFSSLLSTMWGVALWFYQPYMNQSGLKIIYFGLVWASFSVFSIIGSKYAYKIEEKLKEKFSFWLIILANVLSLIFMSYWFVVWGVIFIFMQQFIRGFANPLLQDYTNKHLTSEKRATLLSIQNLSGKLMFSIFGPLFGYFADKYSLSTTLLITGVSFLLAFSLLMLWLKKKENLNLG